MSGDVPIAPGFPPLQIAGGGKNHEHTNTNTKKMVAHASDPMRLPDRDGSGGDPAFHTNLGRR